MSATSPLATHFMKTRIVEASVPVFSARGRQATVQDILEAAQVSRRTFYRYFKNLEELLVALYDVACGVLLDAIRAAIAEAESPLEKATNGIDAFLAFHTSQKSLVLLLAGEARRAGSPLAPRRKAVQAELVALFEQAMAELQERRLDPLIFHSVLWALESLSLHVLSETPAGEEDLARARQVMFAMVARVLGPGDALFPLPEVTP